jgi:hypothetical protein
MCPLPVGSSPYVVVLLFRVCRPDLHGTPPRHRQGAHKITTSIFWELHTHKHPCCCTSNPNRENLHNGVWIKRQQPPSKILKNVNYTLLIFIDFNRAHYFKLGHTAFICDRIGGIYHTVKQFLVKEHLMMAIYSRNMLWNKRKGENK